MPDSGEDPWATLARWFPDLTEENWVGLKEYCELLRDWNSKINLVSRKDTDRLELKHLAHCLTITKFLRLMPKARLLDVGIRVAARHGVELRRRRGDVLARRE